MSQSFSLWVLVVKRRAAKAENKSHETFIPSFFLKIFNRNWQKSNQEKNLELKIFRVFKEKD